jgi:predicted Zn-ribbon and HTH transcriptional regulator
MITSKTCANCGITYAAHFEYPQRCPAWKTDEVDRQSAQEPALLY